MQNLFSILDIIARAGGGGSGGGGGGGGSGGGGGDGGIFALWGYGVGLVCKYLMKLPRPINWIITGIFSIVAVISSFYLPLGWLFGIAAAVGAYLGATGKLDNMHNFIKRHAKIKSKLKEASLNDSQWDWETVKPQVEQIFYKFQDDWANFNYASFQTYMIPYYYKRTMLLLGILQSMGRQNKMSEVKILRIVPVAFHDEADDSRDTLTVAFEAKAKDELWENGQKLYQDNNTFIEEWVFVRNQEDSAWILSNIEQNTRTRWLELGNLQEFANQNGFFYSGDFGWLLMPKRGQLFSKSNFKNSDLNSHVAGVYRNLMVQFYVYAPIKEQSQNRFVIAQAALPKSYGNIVVRRKQRWSWGGTKGLTKISMEWGDFNKMYEVYASDMERVTSFELLHPVFMEKLHALPFKTNIEVVDNVVYLYTQDKGASYEQMLSILNDAFDEMKL
ncbi:DUF3137 domain-containing protein [Candidatus Saccharibacteria bacterium]|nr:DUF3137 domain-containing protein [Candidatus Saccharibacteria bacterium]